MNVLRQPSFCVFCKLRGVAPLVSPFGRRFIAPALQGRVANSNLSDNNCPVL